MIVTHSRERQTICEIKSAFFFPALLYSAFGVVIEKARGAEDDLNTVAAGTLTGMLFKSGGRCLTFNPSIYRFSSQ